MSGLETRRGVRAQALGAATIIAAALTCAWGTREPEKEAQLPRVQQSNMETVQKLENVGGASNACRCSMRIEPED